ncbi:nuclear transport factor 2 family protein [Acinetobacter sp. MB5]|uniref:nuclear transport factor 2 family protein n=1 Tax=Acinetobacter sp. MB5 TaxID=2069438 RepID=UPI000DD05024|nr:nuclear transport factor 2 family protein [Acinetobacter sp. MB5]
MAKIKLLALSALATLALTACKNVESYSDDYAIASRNRVGITLTDQQAEQIAQHFVATFNQLGTPQFLAKANELYADSLYINDTLSQFSSKPELMKHFQGMNARVSQVDVRLVSVTHQKDSAYVHWYMAYHFKMFGKSKPMASYGISQIKINQQQQIIFQQDFWDPADGLYRHLPYMGRVYAWLLPFKKS